MGEKVFGDRTALRRLVRGMPPAVLDVLTQLKNAQAQAFVVGGAVRDAFLGLERSDWDIATDARPEQVAGLFPKVLRIGERHGTVTVLTQAGPVEVTTFRGEGPYLDGRRPSQVVFHHDIEADLSRRDFTINALAADLEGGCVIDPFGGREDLRHKKIRCVGDPDQRFSEDGLRVLRAVRFAGVLGFRIVPSALAAIRPNLDTFAQVAGERKRDELLRLLNEAEHLSYPIKILYQSGIIEVLAPELALLSASAWRSAEKVGQGSALLRLACVAAAGGLDPDQLTSVLERLRLARADIRRGFIWLTGFHRLRTKPPTGEALRRWLALVGADEALAAAAVVEAAKGRSYVGFGTRVRLVLKSKPCLSVRSLAVDGMDLKSLGMSGQVLGRVLQALLDAVLKKPELNQKASLLGIAHKLSTEKTESFG